MSQNASEQTPTAAELQERLMRAYLSGDGAAVVEVMELIAAAEQPRSAPRRAA